MSMVELTLMLPVKFLKPFYLKIVVVMFVVDGCLIGSRSSPGPSRF